MMLVKGFINSLIRRQKIEPENRPASQLNRCLSTLDLTLLGIGSTLGLGIYVIAGQVASTKAGPAVVVSFFIAAVASIFAGLCYAEFGARVPRAGSAYVYSYVTVGEFMAFVIGWNLILEYSIGTASVARGYSGYLDSLFNKTIEMKLKSLFPINLPTVSPYPDFLALGITLLLTIMLSVGVRESTRFNNLFTGLNLLVVLYAVICGAFKSDIKNWSLPKEELPTTAAGEGGFLPFGVAGMMAGAATCFYAFIGFDCIATTGEEVKNPQKSIPISIVLSLLAVFCAYFSVSAVETLMWPYYDQNQSAPLPYVFGKVGWPVAKMVISIGALAGLSTSLLGSMFPLPRILYAMATDGLIFRIFANVHPRFKTPLLATGVSGILAGGMAMMFDVNELADMMSIGTLLAYSLVALSVLILRYKPDDYCTATLVIPQSNGLGPKMAEIESPIKNGHLDSGSPPSSSSFLFPKTSQSQATTILKVIVQIFNCRQVPDPTVLSANISTFIITSLSVLFFGLNSILVFKYEKIVKFDQTVLIEVGVIALVILILIVSLGCQPTSKAKLSFKVPFVPVVPLLSMWINIYLMLQLSLLTWIRFAVWMTIGLFIYFAYGLWHSSLRFSSNERKPTTNSQVPTETNDIQLQLKDSSVKIEEKQNGLLVPAYSIKSNSTDSEIQMQDDAESVKCTDGADVILCREENECAKTINEYTSNEKENNSSLQGGSPVINDAVVHSELTIAVSPDTTAASLASEDSTVSPTCNTDNHDFNS